MTREEEILKMLRDLFRGAHERLVEHRVVLFGSRARGDAKTRSDFDIGVIGETSLPLEDYYALEDQLEDLINSARDSRELVPICLSASFGGFHRE